MPRMLPDPTFYPSAKLASEAPAESLAYVALLTPGENGKKDAFGVVDTDPTSPEYGGLDLVEQLFLRHQPVAAGEEVREDVEDLGLDMQPLLRATELVEAKIELVVAEGVDRVGG